MSQSEPQNDNYNYWILSFFAIEHTTPLFCNHLSSVMSQHATYCAVCVVEKKIRTISDDFQPPAVMLYAFLAESHAVGPIALRSRLLLIVIFTLISSKSKTATIWIS